MLLLLALIIILLSTFLAYLLHEGGYFDQLYKRLFPSRRRLSSDASHYSPDSSPYSHDPSIGTPVHRGRMRQVGSPNLNAFSSDDIVEQLDPAAERHLPIDHILLIRERKTLVLDLDETLIHSSLNRHCGNRSCDFTVDVPINPTDPPLTFYVFKRPHVDRFLRQVEEWYDIVIFTASLSSYADPVVNHLDYHGKLRQRLFRESCIVRNTRHVKDLVMVGFDIKKTIIIDNSPEAYTHDNDNAIPISHYFPNNDDDIELLALLPILYCLRSVIDVRSVLSLHSLQPR